MLFLIKELLHFQALYIGFILGNDQQGFVLF